MSESLLEKISACVHCGLCLDACPTYRELGVEMDSPRGRLYLMKGLLTETIEPTDTVLRHLDQCLDCRACETACPSGTEYGAILEETRTILEPQRKRSWLRRFFFGPLLHSRRMQGFAFKLLWLQQRLGLVALARWLGPGRIRAAARQAPRIPFRSFRSADPSSFPAKGPRRHRVAFFTGCVADHLFPGVNAATVRVLTENGCDVEVIADEACCGALHIHNGERDAAKQLAGRNVEAFSAADVVVSNAAGCSAELRNYEALLETDAARAFGEKVRDVFEFLHEIGLKPPPGEIRARVAYDEPCHLLHAQKISTAPREILGSIRGIEMVPLEGADDCCGSAGIYSITQPDLSTAVLNAKIEAIRKSGAERVVTGNPGCILQIASGIREAGLDVIVAHPVELLAEAYGSEIL